MSDTGNTTVGNNRYTGFFGIASRFINRCGLWTTTCHDFLSRTNGADTHSYAKSVNTGINQSFGLGNGYDVTANDLQISVFIFNVANHFQLVDGISLRRIQNNQIQSSVNKPVQTFTIFRAGTNGGTCQ